MRHQRVLSLILPLMLGAGLVDAGGVSGTQGPVPEVQLLVGLAVSYLCFRWYRADSDARGYRRSRWLSVGVVAFTAGALPYYLARSRAAGERGRALGAYAAYLALAAMAAWVGIATRIALG